VIYPAEHDADVFGNALALMHEVARPNTRDRADSDRASQPA
jgi:hypothetical protein